VFAVPADVGDAAGAAAADAVVAGAASAPLTTLGTLLWRTWDVAFLAWDPLSLRRFAVVGVSVSVLGGG